MTDQPPPYTVICEHNPSPPFAVIDCGEVRYVVCAECYPGVIKALCGCEEEREGEE